MKKFLLSLGLFAAMTAAQAADFSATLLGGEFFFNIVDEDAATCEFAANPNGPYNITLTGAWLPDVVNYNGKDYTIIGVGVEAFKDGYVTNGANSLSARKMEFWGFPTSLTYVRADAFNGFRSNYPALLRGTVNEFDPTAMRNNKIVAINTAGESGTYRSVVPVENTYKVNTQTDQASQAKSVYEASVGSVIYYVEDGVNVLVAYPGDARLTFHKIYTSGLPEYPNPFYDVMIDEVDARDYGKIGDYAFYGNENVVRVDFSSALTAIGAHAFENTVLTSLTLPATLETIGEDAFKGVTTLTSITCNTEVPPVVTFEPEVYVNCKDHVTVPAEYEATYRADEIWGPFFSPAYQVIVAETENGVVEADNYFPKEGDTVTLTVSPDDGYQLVSLNVAGTDAIETTDVGNGVYTFLMPGEDVTVTATFDLIPPPTYTITIADGIENGTVEADKGQAVESETVTLTITPAEGYQLKDVTVTPEGLDLLVEVDENGQFEMPAANVTVTAEFEEIPVVENPIIFTAQAEHGTVAVYVDGAAIESNTNVAEGTEVTVVVTPVEGYKVTSFSVETVEVVVPSGMPRRASVPVNEGENNTYTFQMPGDPITLNIEFTEDTSTGITDLTVASTVTYVNVMGQTSDRPFNGVNIVMRNGKAFGKVVK